MLWVLQNINNDWSKPPPSNTDALWAFSALVNKSSNRCFSNGGSLFSVGWIRDHVGFLCTLQKSCVNFNSTKTHHTNDAFATDSHYRLHNDSIYITSKSFRCQLRDRRMENMFKKRIWVRSGQILNCFWILSDLIRKSDCEKIIFAKMCALCYWLEAYKERNKALPFGNHFDLVMEWNLAWRDAKINYLIFLSWLPWKPRQNRERAFITEQLIEWLHTWHTRFTISTLNRHSVFSC